MPENYNYLFQYLEKERINIDYDEFEFQMKSHPDYPSVIAITDTLHFFNIDNGVLRVSNAEIELLPNRFIAFLKNERNGIEHYFVEKRGIYYYCTKDKNIEILDSDKLIARWSDIVLLVEKSDKEQIHTKKNPSNWFLLIIILGLFGATLFWFHINWQSSLFFIFPILGVLFSVAALKDLFGAKSELLNNFCNLTSSTSCSTVVGSNKWAVFKYVNFSDLSLVFFGSQFLGLFFSILTNSTDGFFTLHKILLVFAVPVILASLYYQKYVEKKWCPICLVIISIILLELGYFFVFQKVSFTFTVTSILLYGLVFISILIAWLGLKKLLASQKELKEFQFKSTRFMRNYDIFKNNLLASEKSDYRPLSSGNLLMGNENAPLKITLVTNPFCGHCKEAHAIIEEILKKHKDSLCVDFRFNFNTQSDNGQSKEVHQKLVRLYYDNGQEVFLKILHDWFENKDASQLVVSEKSTITDLKISEILKEQYLMNQDNKISFTPAIIINQYQYPKMYDRKELVYFVNDLLEDEDFQ